MVAKPIKNLIDIFRDWRHIEADFRREYGIRLTTELRRKEDAMTWREFTTLLNGLSGESIYVLNIQAIKDGKIPAEVLEANEDDEQSIRAIEKEVDKFFA